MTLCISACQKRKSMLEAVKNIAGEYIWSYSTGFPEGNTSEQYGVIIDEKGYLFLFEKDKMKYKYAIEKCDKVNDSLFAFTTKNKVNTQKPDINGTVCITHVGLREMNLANYPYVVNYYYENN